MLSRANWTLSTSRLGAEFLIVVLGVTIALWADGWVTEREDRAREKSRLEALLVNLDATQNNLDDAIDNATGAVEALQKLAVSERYDMPDDEWRSVYLYGMLYGPDFAPELNVYDDLKSSGELALLTATEVRTALARLDAQLLTNQFVENDVATVQAGNIDVYLVDNVDMRVIYGDTLGVTFELSPTAELPDIESDMQLRNRILLKLDIVRFLLDEYRNTRELIQNARNEIAAQLQIDR